MLALKAKPDGCEECVMGAPFYVPCNKPATQLIGWKHRTEGPYRMCDMCADHNVRNRGAFKVSSYEPATPPTPPPTATR